MWLDGDPQPLPTAYVTVCLVHLQFTKHYDFMTTVNKFSTLVTDLFPQFPKNMLTADVHMPTVYSSTPMVNETMPKVYKSVYRLVLAVYEKSSTSTKLFPSSKVHWLYDNVPIINETVP